MDFGRIIDDFAHSERLPEKAIRATLAEGPAIVPKFAELLARYAASGAMREDEDRALAVVIHILGELGDQRAFQPLMDALSVDAERVDRTFGDSITETVGPILIATFDGDFERLTAAMCDLDVDEFVRDAVFDVWTYMVLTDRIAREDALAYLRSFPETVDPPKGDHGWVSWIEAVARLGFVELAGPVERAFAAGCVPPGPLGILALDIHTFRKMLEEAISADDREEWMRRERLRPFGDTIAEVSSWYGYSQKYRRERRDSLMAETVRNPNRAVGRNDPCPCGSGRKYKKCCLQ